MVSLGDIITLDNNNKYIIINILKYQDNDYLYLCNYNDFNDNVYCQLIDNNIIMINNADMINNLDYHMIYE